LFLLLAVFVAGAGRGGATLAGAASSVLVLKLSGALFAFAILFVLVEIFVFASFTVFEVFVIFALFVLILFVFMLMAYYSCLSYFACLDYFAYFDDNLEYLFAILEIFGLF
jgi:uncharacterized membrane protein